MEIIRCIDEIKGPSKRTLRREEDEEKSKRQKIETLDFHDKVGMVGEMLSELDAEFLFPPGLASAVYDCYQKDSTNGDYLSQYLETYGVGFNFQEDFNNVFQEAEEESSSSDDLEFEDPVKNSSNFEIIEDELAEDLSEDEDSNIDVDEIADSESDASVRTEIDSLANCKILILDIDHTLLHGVRVKEESSIEVEGSDLILNFESVKSALISGKWRDDYDQIYSLSASDIDSENREGIFYFKLRPGVIQFLKAASSMYELALCTKATKGYATKVKEILESASGVCFSGGVFSREDFEEIERKNFAPSWKRENCIVVDDRLDVWDKYEDSVIQVERFFYFPHESKQPATTRTTLSRVLEILIDVHNCIRHDTNDIRDVLFDVMNPEFKY